MLRVVGAGLPRTGTRSLKQALELLLGGRCYHMHEVFTHLEDVPAWRAALRGDEPDWHNAQVRTLAPPDRLLKGKAGDGWEPLCAALRLPVPDEPFPHTNTRAEWTS
jgi:Sulfotransferase domain